MRYFIVATCVVMALAAFAGVAPTGGKGDKLWVFIGTYTGKGAKDSKGIYRCELDLASGKLSKPELAAEVVRPSFLAIHPTHKYLYAVAEVGSFDGKSKTGAIMGFTLDAKKGTLSFLTKQPSGGADPCHLVVDKTGKCVLAANYTGGSACVLAIQEDGRLSPPSVVQHKGSSVDPKRQQGPHAHSINLDPGNRFAFVADLGLDKVMIYRFDPAKASLTLTDSPGTVAPGAGPRHFAFRPDGKFAYVINELHNTVTAFAYDAERGALKSVQTVSTLPRGFKGTSYTAEVVVHPSGKFLYGSNRGHDSIAIFSIDEQSGALTLVGHQTHMIKTPRNFAIDPTGRYLIAASQGSGKVIAFRIQAESGALEPTGSVIDVASPVCVRMIPKR